MHNRSHPGDPIWVEDLIRLLEDPPATSILTATQTIDLLAGWIYRSSSASWKRNARSLAEELQRALSDISRSLRLYLNPQMAPVRKALDTLGSPDASPDDRSSLAGLLDDLRQALGHPDALVRAWDDLIWSLEMQNAQPQHVASAMAGLLSASSALGAGDDSRRNAAAHHLKGTNVELFISGVTEPPPFHERLRTAFDALSTLEEPTSSVVWLSYTHAMLPPSDTMWWQHGPITIFEVVWAVPNARRANGQDFPHRDELQAILKWHDDFPKDGEIDDLRQVLVRIELSEVRFGEALEVAEERMQVLLQVAIPRHGLRWRAGNHYFLLRDGTVRRSGGRFVERQPRSWVNVHQARWSSEPFADNATAVIDALSRGDFPHQLREALRIVADVGRSEDRLLGGDSIVDARAVLMLEQQAVEHVAAWMQRPVGKVIDDVIEIWSVDRVYTRAKDAAYNLAVRGEGELVLRLGHRIGEINTDLILCFQEEILQSAYHRWERAQARAAFRAVESPSHFERSRIQIERDFRLERQRHRRVRNALAHGNPIREYELASVEQFGRTVTNTLLVPALKAYVDGREPADTLSSSLAWARKIKTDAQAGRGVSEVPPA